MARDIPELLKKIDELRPMLEANAAQGEADRRVSQESVDALEAIGAFRVTQPAKYGGFQGLSQDHVDVARAVGRADGGTGWITALINMSGWLTALLPEQAQQDVWGEDPNTKVTVVRSISTSMRPAMCMSLDCTNPRTTFAASSSWTVVGSSPKWNQVFLVARIFFAAVCFWNCPPNTLRYGESCSWM